LKASTHAAWGATHKSLLAYFGEKKPLRSITEGDAKAWRRSIRHGLSENTQRKWSAIAKTLFAVASENRLIDRSPFAKLKSGMVANKARMHFVDAETSKKVLEACPSSEWRTIFALARWGGLRCPSELRDLKWTDILWDRGRFIVTSPKTEHQGKPTRIMPIFPELLPILFEASEAAPEGRSTSSRGPATARSISAPSSNGSSSGPASRPGRSCSKTSAAPARRS